MNIVQKAKKNMVNILVKTLQRFGIMHYIVSFIMKYRRRTTSSVASDQREEFCKGQKHYFIDYYRVLHKTQCARDFGLIIDDSTHDIHDSVDGIQDSVDGDKRKSAKGFFSLKTMNLKGNQEKCENLFNKWYMIFSKATTPFRYEQIAHYLSQENGIWPDESAQDATTGKKYFAVSGGTTSLSGENKKKILVPPSVHSMNQRVFYDLLRRVVKVYKHIPLLNYSILSMGGTIREENNKELVADVSALMIHAAFQGVLGAVMPYDEGVLTGSWQGKYELFLKTAHTKNIGAIMGVTGWLAMFLDECQQKFPQHYKELKKTLSCVVRGGVDIAPYRHIFHRHGINCLIGIYNAAEGVIGYQDITYDATKPLYIFAQTGLYELATVDSFDAQGKFVLGGVVFPLCALHQDHLDRYGLTFILIYSPHGQIRTIMDKITLVVEKKNSTFKSVRFKIAGRIGGFINRVGEELMEEQVRIAISAIAETFPISSTVYTVAPTDDINPARHERVFELTESDKSVDVQGLTKSLDETLARINGDYDDKRRSKWLEQPLVHIVPSGTFHALMQQKQKRGGQNKVLHVSAQREWIESILSVKKKA